MKILSPFAVSLLALSAGLAPGAEGPPVAPAAGQTGVVSTEALAAFKPKLRATLVRHHDALLGADGAVAALKGKTAEGEGALSLYLLFEQTGEQKYRRAALALADQVLRDMRATKFGVLPIK
ncbi:MAG: hypothetical protein Q8N18_22290 [Opitutaceae bacterium]|nr:hypothetical protein [Opitutaceae bacterium]